MRLPIGGTEGLLHRCLHYVWSQVRVPLRDLNLYADRNKIERLFNRLKHYRRIATRYAKTARNYMAFLQVASIITLLL